MYMVLKKKKEFDCIFYTMAVYYLLSEGDYYKLEILKNMIRDNIEVWYVNQAHDCAAIQEWYQRYPQWVLVIYHSNYYLDLLKMVIDVNTEIPEELLDDDVRCDTSAVNIGYCVCGTVTQTGFRV